MTIDADLGELEAAAAAMRTDPRRSVDWLRVLVPKAGALVAEVRMLRAALAHEPGHRDQHTPMRTDCDVCALLRPDRKLGEP